MSIFFGSTGQSWKKNNIKDSINNNIRKEKKKREKMGRIRSSQEKKEGEVRVLYFLRCYSFMKDMQSDELKKCISLLGWEWSGVNPGEGFF